MDIRKIQKLIQLFDQSDIAEIEIQEGEDSIRINRYSSQAPAAPAPPAAAPLFAAPPSAPLMIPTAEAMPAAAPAPALPNGDEILSPMVGTFYRSAAPTSPAFVEEGQTVQQGDTLCIIEAMKILNQITAEKSGKIVKIMVENGSPVEYDQALFVIE